MTRAGDSPLSSSDTAALAASHVSKSFGGVRALDECSVVIDRGSITGIIGPNGAGKSTLLNVVSGLLRPDGGQVRVDGVDATGASPREMARRGVVRTFQLSRELAGLTALENVMLALTPAGSETIASTFFRAGRLAREEARRRRAALALLARVGLDSKADDLAGTLSGGQKKLLELTRALALDPKIILLDEPTAGVNPTLRNAIAAFIRELRDAGVTFGIVEHDMGFVARLCDTVVVLAEGRDVMRGSHAEVTSDRRVIEAYLGAVA